MAKGLQFWQRTVGKPLGTNRLTLINPVWAGLRFATDTGTYLCLEPEVILGGSFVHGRFGFAPYPAPVTCARARIILLYLINTLTMKQLLTTLLLALLLYPGLQAQVQYGTIDYIRTVERDIEIDGVGMEANKEIKAMLAKMAASGAFAQNFQATFTPEGFTFIQQVREVNSVESELGGGNMIVVETGGEDPTHFYTDVKNGKVLNKQFIFDKTFLVSGDLQPVAWTITDETVAPSDATIGLDLKIATGITASGDTITAGFAPSVPVQVGPNNIYGLPGAIITLTYPLKDGGSVVFRATAMTLSQEAPELVPPTEGKKISLEKFREEKKKRQRTMTRTIIRN